MAVAPYPSLVDQLYRVEGKAEIVNGEIVSLMSTGGMPNYAAGEIFASLRLHVRSARLAGRVVTDNGGFLVRLPHRQSFSPDAAYFEGPKPGMRFYEGAPQFAVEVRSENDYGIASEIEMRAKRDDYFAAGTLVVWDVDLQGEEVVRKYSSSNGADQPVATFRRGETANAEPAVPGWTMSVDDLFEPEY